MENLTTLRQKNLIELSCSEQIEIQGGEVIGFMDSKGYFWLYTYDMYGTLTNIEVQAIQCIL